MINDLPKPLRFHECETPIDNLSTQHSSALSARALAQRETAIYLQYKSLHTRPIYPRPNLTFGLLIASHA